MPNCKNYRSKPKCNRGVSLIECMLASALGIFLFWGILEVYASVKTTYHLQHALARIQENGRYAIYFLNQNIRLAGYEDCKEKIQGYSSKQLPDFLRNSSVVSGTDVIVISRCDKTIRKKIAYFIAKTSYKNSMGSSLYGLYEKTLIDEKNSEPAQEIVTNVNDMQISYGISTDNKNISSYQKLPTDWETVRSVAITLSLNSDTNNLSKAWSTYITLRTNPKLPANLRE